MHSFIECISPPIIMPVKLCLNNFGSAWIGLYLENKIDRLFY
ncbi:hypothetical protein K013_1553 [Acinetobacter baumannii 25569_7]|nr:hypothetical protein K013_1553 [Acinetobacter baumannii 25569_7]